MHTSANRSLIKTIPLGTISNFVSLTTNDRVASRGSSTHRIMVD